MTLPKLHIGNLTADVPIVQGGMGIGVSLSGLASAVANEGGVGVISAANIGFNEPDFRTHTIEANLRAIKEQLRIAKEKAKRGIIGMNIMWKGQHYEDYARCAAENFSARSPSVRHGFWRSRFCMAARLSFLSIFIFLLILSPADNTIPQTVKSCTQKVIFLGHILFSFSLGKVKIFIYFATLPYLSF